MWFDIAITVSCAGGGLVCGWILHAFSGMDHERWGDESEGERSTLTSEEVTQAADQIRAFANGMVADVDAHQSRVEAVNNSLIQTGPDTSADEVAVGIERASAFLMTREDGNSVGRIFLSGGGARIPGMAEALANRMNLETEVVNPFERVPVRPDAAQGMSIDEAAPMLLLPLGLALRT